MSFLIYCSGFFVASVSLAVLVNRFSYYGGCRAGEKRWIESDRQNGSVFEINNPQSVKIHQKSLPAKNNAFVNVSDAQATISQVYSEQKVLLGNSNVPLSVYFDWSEPIIPSSILITYVHFILFLILLRIISIKHDGGSLQDFWKIK